MNNKDPTTSQNPFSQDETGDISVNGRSRAAVHGLSHTDRLGHSHSGSRPAHNGRLAEGTARSNIDSRQAERERQHWRTLVLMDAKQPLVLERRQPCLFQDGKRLRNRIPLREDHKGMSREQLTTQLTRELPKQAFHPISADGSPKSLPHHNTDPAATHVCSANHQIKQGRRDTTALLLSILNVAAAFEKQIPVTPTLRHRRYPGRRPACTGLLLRDQISRLGHDHTPLSCVGNYLVWGTLRRAKIPSRSPSQRRSAYTVKRARPFARRRAKTFRPFFVLIRLRNPCSRFFLRFDGCADVNDIRSLLA